MAARGLILWVRVRSPEKFRKKLFRAEEHTAPAASQLVKARWREDATQLPGPGPPTRRFPGADVR
jgi:hypothetical protein